MEHGVDLLTDIYDLLALVHDAIPPERASLRWAVIEMKTTIHDEQVRQERG